MSDTTLKTLICFLKGYSTQKPLITHFYISAHVQYSVSLSLSLSLTQRHADAVTLGVQQASDLGEVAVEAAMILVHGALEEKSVFGV